MRMRRTATVIASALVVAGAGLTAVQATASTATANTVSAAPEAAVGSKPARDLDLSLISKLRTKDHTEAVKKIRIKLVSKPSRTVWTSTRRSVDIQMLWRISDPERVAKRVRVCFEDVIVDESGCKSHVLRNFRKPRGDFSMKRTAGGWEVLTAPIWRARSPYQCSNHEYYRPRMRWFVSVVDPRDGSDAVTGRFAWTVRCSG
jgi:hypothetical protein